MEEIASLQNISKQFGNTRALSDVSLSINIGEIYGLVGENGAGKSTLAKIIAGDIAPDSGVYVFQGRRIENLTPKKAREMGIAIVHQWGDLSLNLSVLENIFLGNEMTRFMGFLDKVAMRKKAREVLNELGLDIDFHLPLSQFSASQQQIITIAKALCLDSKLLIVDEGGVSLDREDLSALFDILINLKKKGIAILYISHLLNNILDLCDRITVLRNGHLIDSVRAENVSVKELAALIVGHEVGQSEQLNAIKKSDEIGLRLESLGWKKSTSYSFKIHKKEIVGITGPAGAGKSELMRTIMGLMPPVSGQLFLGENEIINPTPVKMIRRGVAFVPEDRFQEGLVLNRTIEENISLPNLWRSTSFFLDKNDLNKRAKDHAALLRTKMTGIQDRPSYLSGGNQQKVVIAKWMYPGYRVFLFDEPYKGIDIGAKEEINVTIKRLAAKGATVMVASTEFVDLIGFVDRLLIMVNQKIVAALEGYDITSQNIIQHYQMTS